jgi:hypothetical protein
MEVEVADEMEKFRSPQQSKYIPPKQTKRAKQWKKPDGRVLSVTTTSLPHVPSDTVTEVPANDHSDIMDGPDLFNLASSDFCEEGRGAALEILFEKLDIDNLKISEEQHTIVKDLIAKHQAAFSMEDFDLGKTTTVEHTIETGDAVPIKQRPRRVPPRQQQFVDQTVKGLLDRDLIKESQSPWSSPIVLAKKHDGSYRLCVDYRRLNSCTVKSAQPLARIDDTLNQLSGSTYFSCLDCASGYWQVGVAP